MTSFVKPDLFDYTESISVLPSYWYNPLFNFLLINQLQTAFVHNIFKSNAYLFQGIVNTFQLVFYLGLNCWMQHWSVCQQCTCMNNDQVQKTHT